MSGSTLIILYSVRLVLREWRRFILPFFSLTVTAVVMMLILLLTSSSGELLTNQSRALLGGDVVLNATRPILSDDFWATTGVIPLLQSEQIDFSGTLESASATAAFSVSAVDAAYPLYGEFGLVSGTYHLPSAEEIYIDVTGADRLDVGVGDSVNFGEHSYTVAGIITSEPTALFSGFRFLPTAVMSTTGFAAANVDPALLRAEYRVATKFDGLSATAATKIREAAGAFDSGIEVDIAGENDRGLQTGLRLVSDFLIIAVLITAVLAAVNVYASTIYLIRVERKSLAILLALGLSKARLTLLLGMALSYIVILAGIVGNLVGLRVFQKLSGYIALMYTVALPDANSALYAGLTCVLIATIAATSFLPAVRSMLALNPRQILIGSEQQSTARRSIMNICILTFSTLAPMVVLASFLLKSFRDGAITILLVAAVYLLIAGIFSFLLKIVYAKRHAVNFFWRSIISQKKADGLFGIISFTSLFVALTALGTLTLLQISLERFLTEDLAKTVPTTYVLDVQPSQHDQLIAAFPTLELFANTPARITEIDGLRIQEELAAGSESLDRELGREFNLTSRRELLSNETVTNGVWSQGREGEISVDEEFAKRSGIAVGSTMEFLIQGFPVRGTVTSFRSTDSRSGLPFFYFVMSPDDLDRFPSVYFGYAFFDTAAQASLGTFVAREMPNVSVFETQQIGVLVTQLVRTLLVLVLVVTLPPLLIATLLIATLVVSSYSARRRDGARLRAIGSTRMKVLRQYLVETMSITAVAAFFAYGASVGATYFISTHYLNLPSPAIFDGTLLIGLGLIIVFVGVIGFYLFKSDTMPLRELLSYESNY